MADQHVLETRILNDIQKGYQFFLPEKALNDIFRLLFDDLLGSKKRIASFRKTHFQIQRFITDEISHGPANDTMSTHGFLHLHAVIPRFFMYLMKHLLDDLGIILVICEIDSLIQCKHLVSADITQVLKPALNPDNFQDIS